ncbi:hypothetical protein [Streptomyces albicerus]|uniref:hypothetical protein n=1 Tax=Streptomyces albicerus TaxID=2569859 RepID=UPI00124AE45E|nr:hypothetical protein [Streptomyces albicerus]
MALRDVALLLAGVAPHEWDGIPVPDPGAAVARARGATAGLFADEDSGTGTTTAGETLRAADAGTGVRADVALREKGWGTEVSLSLGGVRGPRTCSLVAVSRSGRQVVVAHWTVPKKGYGVPGAPDELKLTSGSSLSPDDIAAFEVLTSDGDRTDRLVRVTRRT